MNQKKFFETFQIIYLNGPSSSGKTTLARALQNALEKPFLLIGIDKIIGFMPHKINDFNGESEREGFFWKVGQDPHGHTLYHIQAGPFAKKITNTLKDIVLLLAKQGYHIIIDDVAFGAVEVEQWKRALRGYNVLYVGVITPLEILEQRERDRKDRMIGSARAQYYTVHENASYHLEVDTHAHSLEENVKKILNYTSN